MVFTVDLDGELGQSVRNASEARDVAGNVFIDYEANAILVGIVSLVVKLVTTLCSGLDILLPSFWSRRFLQYRS